MVPIASKKIESRMVKTSSSAARAPRLRNASSGATAPTSERSGSATKEEGAAGTTSDHPVAFSADEPDGTTASSTWARAVVRTTAIRMAPRTLRTMRARVSSRPTTNVSIGQPSSVPPSPSCTGTVVPAASGIRDTNTAVRNPVRTRTNMIRPAHTTRPMTCGHVSSGVVTIVTARNAFTPRPVAIANGERATTPIRMVITPATSAVTAATRSAPRTFPAPSGP